MNILRNLTILLLLVAVAKTGQAQQPMGNLAIANGVFKAEREPMKYTYLREADAMWTKILWSKIDLREKINQPMYFPRDEKANRISLMNLIKNAVDEGSVSVYDPVDDEFGNKIPWSQAKSMFRRVDTVWIENPDPPYDLYPKEIVHEFDPAAVKEFRIKEVWFFDKQRSKLDFRIIGICPVADNIDPETGEVRGQTPLFWIYFPELRPILASHGVFIRHNGTTGLTYDDLFHKRMFSAYIYKEQNVYDRQIRDYKQGKNALLEAEKIRNEMFTMEFDLWEY